jgi:hypothetical protein
MRRTLTTLALLSIVAFWSACGGNSNTSANAGRDDSDTTVNSERVESSNIAPTGGPGPEPEGRGGQSSGNTNESKAENKNKADKNKNTQ